MVFTRRKKIISIIAVTAVLAVVLAGILSEYGTVSPEAIKAQKDYIASYVSEDESSWTKLDTSNVSDGKQVTLENDRLTLKMDLSSTHFVVAEKTTGTFYESYPQQEPALLSEEDIARANSNIALTYYDTESKIHYLGSCNDAVKKGQYSVYQKGNRLRVIYVIGSAASNLFAPEVITQETMESKVFAALKASEKAKLKLYYKLYSAESKPADYDEKMKLYPSIKGKNVYILSNEVTDQILDEISSLMVKSGYTKEESENEMTTLGITESNGNLPAGFTIPLELSLDEDGFIAEVLTDRIEENNTIDKIAQVYLLEYFGAKNDKQSGYMLVPDGSGAKIDFNQAAQQSYSQHFYNEDLLLSVSSEQQLSRNVPLPYFGMACNSGSFLAVVEGGAGMGSVFARTMGKANPLNMMGAYFDLRAVDKTDIGQDRNIPTLNVYSGHILYEHPAVHYTLLPYSDQILNEMAQVYRNKLQSKGALQPIENSTTAVPLYLDFVCLSTTPVDVLGVAVSKQVVMSTLSEITNVVETLQESGITNLRVRLKGWTDQGLKHNAFSQCKLSGKVGTADQLAALRQLLAEKGGALYLDTDFSFAQTNRAFDQFALSRDTVRNLESTVVSLKEFDRVTLEKRQIFRQGFVITPNSYLSFIKQFLTGYASNEYKGLGLSWSAGGMYLVGDYNRKTDLDMAYSATVSATAFAQLADAGDQQVMTDYGYDYTLPYVNDIVNCPITSSYFNAETASLPFLQMVLSGAKNMTGPALNFTGTQSQFVEMASTASAPYYLFMTEDNAVLRELDIQNSVYSLDYRMHLTDLITAYQAYNGVVSGVYGTKMVKFQWLNEMVSCTTFENGKEVWVNRSSQIQSISGMTLQPYSYQLKG